MTSTRLPERAYYRANAIGNGAYGAVCIAYDDDGSEWAAKLFWDETGEEEGGDDDDWEDCTSSGIDAGILREIAMLRLLNGAHPNVLSMHDVSRMDGSNETLALVMPRMSGSLSGAIEKQTLDNKDKLKVAALSLHGLAWLHSHGIIHRDLKPDNILMDADGAPVLADFSLAKVVGGKVVSDASSEAPAKKKAGRKRARGNAQNDGDGEAAAVLTASMGTPTYTAPEIVAGESYGLKADVFSMGVVLLELFHGSALDAWKDKHALAQLEAIKAKLSDKPVPKMLKAMLEVDPEKRCSAEEALAMLPGVEKVVPAMPKPGSLFLPHAPKEGGAGDDAPPAKRGGERPAKRAKKGADDSDVITPGRLCRLLETANPQTAADAEHLWQRSEVARSKGTAGAVVCALVSCKISETETWTPDDVVALRELKDLDWDVEAYAEDEREVLADVGYTIITRTAAVSAEDQS